MKVNTSASGTIRTLRELRRASENDPTETLTKDMARAISLGSTDKWSV